MKFLIRQKVIIWILAGMLTITLSILGSLIYHTWAEPEEVIGQAPCSTSCVRLFDELDLDEVQHVEIEKILDHFKDTSATLITELRQRRLALMEELQNDDSDSLRIFILSEELGAIQVRMTNQATSQYLQIRAICKPDQRQKLSNIYCDLFGCSRIKMGKGQGQGQHRNSRGGK